MRSPAITRVELETLQSIEETDCVKPTACIGINSGRPIPTKEITILMLRLILGVGIMHSPSVSVFQPRPVDWLRSMQSHASQKDNCNIKTAIIINCTQMPKSLFQVAVGLSWLCIIFHGI